MQIYFFIIIDMKLSGIPFNLSDTVYKYAARRLSPMKSLCRIQGSANRIKNIKRCNST